MASGATTLLPPLAAAALDFELGGALFLALNYAEWGDGALQYFAGHPLSLARSWEFGPDSASLTYRLDPSRRWSDGRPIRAADIAFTYGLLADTALALPLSSTTERLDSVSVLDDATVTFHFDRSYPGMLFDTGVGIIPEHVYGTLPREELRGLPRFREEGGPALVVSGPFRLETWQPTDRIVLARNPASVVVPRLDRIVIRVVPEETTRLAELRTSRIDVAVLTSYRAAAALENDTRVRVARVPQRGFDYIAWNPVAHPAFADPRVRRALSSAVDREALIRALDMEGYAEPAFGPYGSLFPSLRPESPDDPAFDVSRARAVLESAGWLDSDGNGVRERGESSLRFELATPTGNERRATAVQIIQQQLAAVGAQVQLRFEEFGSLLNRTIGRQYEAVLLGWQVGLDPDIAMFWGDVGSPFNVVGYDEPTVQALIGSAQAQPSYAAAAPYWREAADRIASDHPYTFLWFFDTPVAVAVRLRAVDVGVTGWAPGMHRWWIPEARRR